MPTSKLFPVKIGITMGDPSGIGPGIIAKSLLRFRNLAEFVIIGDKWVFDKIPIAKPQIPNHRFIDLHNVARNNFTFGQISAGYGRASMEYLDKAMELIKAKEIECLVTAPISKEAINLAGFAWPGHTEYLAKHSQASGVVMMLLNKKLKFALVTRHTALKKVPLELNQDNISHTILLAHKYLREWFLIESPRIVVCGLNPHASDNGVIGHEEKIIIKPAIRHCSRKIGNLFGPLPCDVAIAQAAKGKYDCVVAMYHDQALIPLKVTDASSGVNISLGLRFVRTSPLHGTAFDIARTPELADPSSFIAAIQLAQKCVLNQRKD